MKDSSDPPTTIEDTSSSENFYEKQVLKLTTIASVSSIVANILISATILRFKNLRKDVTNGIILHVVLVQIASLFLDEVLLWFFTYFGTPLPQYHAEFCVIFVGVRMLNAISFFVVVLLVCNWYMKIFASESRYAIFKKYYTLVLVFIYVSCILLFPFLTRLCLKMDVFETFYVVLSIQIFMIVFAVFMNLVKKFKRNNGGHVKDVGLGVANIIVFFCTPAYLFLVLAYYNVVPVYIVLFADVLATGVFPFVFFYLYKYDRNFQMYFKKMVVCDRRGLVDESVSYNLINNVET